ncbi:MAG: hypothetical protein ACI81R_002488 [Bradymonadia bacterium]|jgi:hypothetical protein
MELALQHVSQEPGDRGGGVDADRTAALPTANGSVVEARTGL